VLHFVGSLRFRLILLVLLAVVPALGLTFYSGLELRRWAGLKIREDAMRLVRHAAFDQELLMQGAAQVLITIAQFPSIRDPDEADILGFLDRLLQQHPYYTNLEIIGGDGKVRFSVLPPGSPINYADTPWFKTAVETRNLVIGEYQSGRVSGKAELPIAYPVFDQSGQLRVMAYTALDLSWLDSLAAKTQLPPGSTLAIIDRQGTLLVRHPDSEKWIGKTIPQIETIKEVLAKAEGTAEAVGIDGNERLYAFASLGGMPGGLYMRVGLLKEEAFVQANQVLFRNLFALGLVLVLALLAAWLFGSLLIMRGIDVLVGATRKLTAGDLSVRTGLGQGEGEIHQLARAFDSMVEVLQQRETRHQQAEAELEKMNNYLENVFDESADSIAIVDEKGKFNKWNKAGLEVYGYTLEDVIGKSAFDLYQDKNELEKMLAQLRRDGFVRNYEISMKRKDGSIMPFALSIRLLRDNDHKAIGSIAVARDLSDLRRAMAESEAANQRLQQEINERKLVEVTLHETMEKLEGTISTVEQRSQHITLLNEMSDLLQSCLTREEAYQGIAQFVPQLFLGLSGTLFILSPRKGLLVEAVATWGTVQSDEQVFTADKCWALRRGGLHLVKGGASALVCKHIPVPLSADYMCVPMVAQGEIIGLLYLQAPPDRFQDPLAQSDQYLTEMDQNLAVTVAKQISLALANLNLRESLHFQAIVDPLTGLFNRRYMEETFTREIHRAKRKKAPISVIMVDLDHFKRINDNFGHAAGDLLLITLAGLLKKHIRREDIPCRYGGEEFLLILPEASLELTHQRAEKLRELVAQLEVRHLGLSLGTVTASFGVASYPEHGEEWEEVISVADAALYRAKEEGRNRVVAGSKLQDQTS
jgi:diguanylate cyclase (GGDEF)-like protein/PAS domain S-box-containing protein